MTTADGRSRDDARDFAKNARQPTAGERPDDPLMVMEHADRFYGGRALIVLGGPSGKNWRALAEKIKPDVILTANGATDVPGAEYWMLAENMSYQWHLAKRGDKRGKEFIRIINLPNGARFRLVNFKSVRLLKDKENVIPIKRAGYEAWEIPQSFTLREYVDGYLSGGYFQHAEAVQPGISLRVGTVGLQLLHHAGILGCREAHTIGFDLMYKGVNHHWYKYPGYQADSYSTEAMNVERRYEDVSVQTRWAWVESAEYLKAIEYLFERDGLEWRDHSEGLLGWEGLRCAI